ncbi:hypothetical protein [Acidocella sp.]|uniref:hypothetical protein n=1 Tax=Acidocella sp. TaxID=50710 RepID=UPI00262716BE|nr:hypothetical protein [Acidocella sp.]
MRGGLIALFSYPVTREEHTAIIEFIGRAVGGEQPPMDVEADAIIRALFKRNPDAAYRVTMMAMALAAHSAGVKPVERPRSRRWFTILFERREAVRERREPEISSHVIQL